MPQRSSPRIEQRRAASHAAAADGPRGASGRARRRHALLVEDDPAFARRMALAVDQLGAGWELHACQTGNQAIETLRRPGLRLDLALVDLGLPYVSGLDVIRAARARFPELPIVVISIITSETSVLAAIRNGANGYVLKNDSELSIAHAIDQILAGVYPISSALARTLFRAAGGGHPTAADAATTAAVLSRKEIELLSVLAHGYTYAEAAARMGIALSTVQHHVRNLYRKLGARSRTQAISKGREGGLL